MMDGGKFDKHACCNISTCQGGSGLTLSPYTEMFQQRGAIILRSRNFERLVYVVVIEERFYKRNTRVLIVLRQSS